MGIEVFFQAHGIPYEVIRDKILPRTEIGLINHDQNGKEYIGFLPGVDIRAGDILENPAGDRFYVIDTKTDYFRKQPQQIKAFYETEAGRHTTPSVFIENAYNSVIGTGNMVIVSYTEAIDDIKKRITAETSPDKDELEKLISLLEMVVNNQVPASKGLFSKFLNVMEKNSWISGAVMGVILNWLTTQLWNNCLQC